MKIEKRAEILELLRMPEEAFRREILPLARQMLAERKGNAVSASAMLGYSNICKNQCLYCGMRAGNNGVHRYRIEAADVLRLAQAAAEMGLTRLFLVSGEDPKYGFASILGLVRGASEKGLRVSLAAGEFTLEQFRELKAAGLYEYVLKFEMADRETFNRLNPSTDFDARMAGIRAVQASGLRLASGNIVDYPGQTLEQLADDILLMRDLDISWAPIIPYMPAAGTPLAAESGRGSLDLNRREIAILRLMLPEVDITAQQPGENPQDGLTAADGNLGALAAGANRLFVDLLPAALAGDFRVIDHRNIQGLAHIRDMAEQAGMSVEL